MLTEEQIQQYKQEHGKLVQITIPGEDGADGQLLLFKRAAPNVWADYQEAISKEKGTNTAAFRRLSYACAVYPDAKGLEPIFREYPALPTRIALQITNISGQGDEFEVKKL